jgi:hypothetical protein
MNRSFFALILIATACNQNKAETTSASSSAAAVQVNAPIGSVAVAATTPSTAPAESGQNRAFSGSFAAQVNPSATTNKEGAPQAWSKDDGKKFTGDGKLTLEIAANGAVQGKLSGALGDLLLRGKLTGDDLRAVIVTSGGETGAEVSKSVARIQNGTLVMARAGNGFKGTLTAATGDSQILRRAELQVAPAAP